MYLLELIPVSDRHWFVSHRGADDSFCGQSREIPCRTLDYVTQRAVDNDIIHVDGSAISEESQIYVTCSALPNGLRKSLTFTGESGRAVVTRGPMCTQGGDGQPQEAGGHNGSAQAPLRNSSMINVTYENIHFIDVELGFSNGSLSITNCTFVNSTVNTVDPCHSITVQIVRSSWHGLSFVDSYGKYQKIMNSFNCIDTELSIIESQFMMSSIVLHSNRSTSILVSDSEFVNDPGGMQYLGGMHLIFQAFNSRIVLRNSLFQNQVG